MASSSSSKFKYDVFISFRGEDTRENFTSHLYAALCRRKIKTFIDYELRRGEEISPALLTAIENSSLSVVILSENYASSSWCLEELSKIIECKNTKGQIVLPVFYHVSPSDVQKQSGSYGEAFAKHEERFRKTEEQVRSWRAALTQVANLSSWPSQHHHGTESELVEKIVKDVMNKLNHTFSSGLDGLVGIKLRMERLESLLCIGTMEVRIIGIWGMGGIGKTTIAGAMFNQIANQFEGCCFLANVREESARYGLNRLREKLLFEVLEDGVLTSGVFSFRPTFTKKRLCRKKVLIVLDDIDNSQQTKFLVGDRDWLGPGSRIIITSRDKQVLKIGVDDIYELEKLNHHESLQLFCFNAFKHSHPTKDYMELSSRVIYYTQGIPLALKVLGCFLFGRGKQDWESTLKKLEKNPNMNIQNVLKISFDGLDSQEKEIFLDLVCFFKGEDKDCVVAILDGCGFFTEIAISVLTEKCLITIMKNKILMHDLIQEMGRDIVRQESIKEPGKRSRLWEPQDICYLFKKNTGTESIESISLDLSKVRELHLSSDAFLRMNKLRLLKFYSSRFDVGNFEDDKIHLSQGLEFLSDELRYLQWHRYPLKSLPSKFNPENLVEIVMHHSNIEYLWKGTQNLPNLRQIDLSYSRHLIEPPDLTLAPYLEILALEGCSFLTKFPKKNSWNIKKLNLCETAIEEVPSAIGSLYQLDSLRLNDCRRLKNLPSSIRNLTSLKGLFLRGCSNITEFPQLSGDLRSLNVGETAIEELPSSVECLTKLSTLSLENCTRLKNVSSSIFKLKSLETIYLIGCDNLEALPEISETTESLKALFLQGSGVREVPSSIERFTQISVLQLGNCKNIASLPNSLFNLRSLTSLVLSGLPGVDKLLENLPLSLLSGLCSLTWLFLSDCNLLELPSALSCLSSLDSLYLDGNNFESLNLKAFSCLKGLDISYCKRLQSIQEFPSPLQLTDLEAHECISLETLPTLTAVDFTVTKNSGHNFRFSNCFKLAEDAQRNILANAQQRIQVMAANARWTASIEDYDEWHDSGATTFVCFPGSEIPCWFSHQNLGSSITIELPQHWYSSKFLGFALCVVVAFDNHSNNIPLDVECKCNFETKDGVCNNINCSQTCLEVRSKPRFLYSDHVFVLFAHRLYAMTVQADDYDHWFGVYQSCHRASFQFSALDGYGGLLQNCKVIKCGVCLLYLEEAFTEKCDSSDKVELVESGCDSNSYEEKEELNSQTMEVDETISEDNSFWFGEGGVCDRNMNSMQVSKKRKL